MVEETSVITVLRENNISFSLSGRDAVIRCLNPEHPDLHPSLRIDKYKGIGKCLSCGYTVNIFKHFGVSATSYGNAGRIAEMRDKIQAARTVVSGIPMPKDAVEWRQEYRGISRSTLRHFGAFQSVNLLPERIIFPINNAAGKVVAFNGRLLDTAVSTGTQDKRYKIYPTGATLPLFPGQLVVENHTIVLVEGMFDAINLYDKGLKNVAALLGTNGLHSKKGLDKAKLASLKLAGVTRVVLMLDGDEPGINAASELKPLLEKEGFQVLYIELPDMQDPGELSLDQVNKYIDIINSGLSDTLRKED